jgi:hypothetical protein
LPHSFGVFAVTVATAWFDVLVAVVMPGMRVTHRWTAARVSLPPTAAAPAPVTTGGMRTGMAAVSFV